MRFGEVDVRDAAGTTLAHAVRTKTGRLAKGTVLGDDEVAALVDAGLKKVTVATLEVGDVAEDEAASRVARALAGSNLRADKARDGRANLYAARAGLLRVDAKGVNDLNDIDAAITLATLRDREHVLCGRLVATVKVIPYAAPEKSVERCEALGASLRVEPYKKNDVALVQTRGASFREGILDKTRKVTEVRLAELGSRIVSEERCAHEVGELAPALGRACGDGPDILLVSCASAVTDGRDVLPVAIDAVGGEVRSVGMPVDPGNLLVLGRIGRTAVIGMPGCARSPKPNGFDWVLRRLCAGECVTDQDVRGMGVGGLLDEVHARTAPRAVAKRRYKFAAILLAAGKSTRMGDRNKLLESWHGAMLVRHAAASIKEAKDKGVLSTCVLVTGNDAREVAKACDGLGLQVVHNDLYETGMASSLKAGIAALPDDVDGAFVCLGDMPGLKPSLLSEMAVSFRPEEGRDMVVPVCGSKRGHPVLFGARHFAALSLLSGDTGARAVLADNSAAVAEVSADEGVLVDLDSPEAFG